MAPLLTKRTVSFAAVAAALAALVGLLVYGLTSNSSSHPLGSLPIASRPAPDFTLRLFDAFGGGTVSKADLLGQPVVLNFWSSWCPSCREEAPALEQVWREYKDRGVRFLGVSVQDSESDALGFIDRFDITFPNAPASGDIALDFGTVAHPETYFINREGMIVRKFVGPVKVEQLRSLVEEILQ
jgi:cytochrome c biogenesis protein CcmG/thiol:disulfide interchange protein DsbE